MHCQDVRLSRSPARYLASLAQSVDLARAGRSRVALCASVSVLEGTCIFFMCLLRESVCTYVRLYVPLLCLLHAVRTCRYLLECTSYSSKEPLVNVSARSLSPWRACVLVVFTSYSSKEGAVSCIAKKCDCCDRSLTVSYR